MFDVVKFQFLLLKTGVAYDLAIAPSVSVMQRYQGTDPDGSNQSKGIHFL